MCLVLWRKCSLKVGLHVVVLLYEIDSMAIFLQLILLILQNKLRYMSGAAQKHVFGIMEEMLTEGRTSCLSCQCGSTSNPPMLNKIR